MAYDVFFVIGAVLIVGFFTSQIFERTKFPDILLLIFIGILLGPVLNLVSIEGVISSLAPYIGILALIIMLFDGGLMFNLESMRSTALTMALAAGINMPYFVEIVFSIIILTNLATAFGIFAVERKLAANARIASQADSI